MLDMLMLAPAILFALTIHEYAHGWVADKLGDPTARYAGRLTLNPLSHLDPLGTMMLFLVHFGWAKPVPVDPGFFKNPKRDMMWVSLAGPAANIVSAAIFGWIVQLLVGIGLTSGYLLVILQYGVMINVVLGIFNLIPIPPLDGSKILMGLLPPEQAFRFQQLERKGPLILLGIILVDRWIPILSKTIGSSVRFFSRIFMGF
ncbi:MAG: site-2 protease family protein [Candidatus Latescibacteria bacterium]|nr:site-2 protease family protein [Candidatus Latescibacterota bacterium]